MFAVLWVEICLDPKRRGFKVRSFDSPQFMFSYNVICTGNLRFPPCHFSRNLDEWTMRVNYLVINDCLSCMSLPGGFSIFLGSVSPAAQSASLIILIALILVTSTM